MTNQTSDKKGDIDNTLSILTKNLTV